jgi:hypothetical protein
MSNEQYHPKGLEDRRCKDLTGKEFGFWTVKSLSPKRLGGRVTWVCECKCGKTKEMAGIYLTRKISKSCGCQHHLRGSQNSNWKGFGEISQTKWNHLRHNARARKIPFSLSIKDAWGVFLKQERKCALTGLPLAFSSLSKSKDGNASVDRIDSKLGYTKSNIQWIDKRFNWMKSDYDLPTFVSLCKLVAAHN